MRTMAPAESERDMDSIKVSAAAEVDTECGGRYWDRTSDLFRVREARYRCANRPSPVLILREPAAVSEVATGFEPVWTALQAAASPLGHSTRGESLRRTDCFHSSG